MLDSKNLVAPHYELPSQGLFEIQAFADYDEKGESIRRSLVNAIVKGIDSIYGMRLDETTPLAGLVRGYYSKKSFIVPNNYLVVRTPMGLIKEVPSNKKWPFMFSGLFALNFSSHGCGFTRGKIQKPVSLDSTEIIRARGNENCDLVVIKFSTEVLGCQEDVSLPKLEDLERPLFCLPKNPRRMAETVLAMATYGSELLMVKKLRNDFGFIIRKPRTLKDAEKLIFHAAKYSYTDAKSIFEHIEEFNHFRFMDKRIDSYFRREGTPRLLVEHGCNYSSCEQYVHSLENLATMINRAVDFLDHVQALPSGFHYSEFSEFGEIAFSKHSADDEKEIRATFTKSLTEIQIVIDAVRRDLLPLVKETEVVWQNEHGTKADVTQVAIHYILQTISLDPLMYADHENEYIRSYVQMLICG